MGVYMTMRFVLCRYGTLFSAFPAALALVALLWAGCEQPGGSGSRSDANTALRSLEVGAGNLSPPFDGGRAAYRVEVNHRVTELTILAEAAGRNAVVSGAGTVSLSGDDTTVTLTVRAESGAAGTYRVRIVRLDDTVVPLASAADLRKIGVEEGYSPAGDYALAGDLTLEDWTPVAPDADHAFSGTLDGKGRTITFRGFDGAAVSGGAYLGVFGYVRGADNAKAEIKNLRIDASVEAESAHAAGQAAGLIAGYAEHTEIRDITLGGNFSFKSLKNSYAGGVAGCIGKGTMVKDCDSDLDMRVDGGNGGGPAEGMYYNFAGGFVGLFMDGGELIGCHNRGAVTADCTTAGSQVFAGGIAGGSYYAFTTVYQGKIEDCVSTGDITAKSGGSWSWAGGIAGCVAGDGDGTLEKTTRIMRCRAEGTVSVKDSGADFPYAGGIVGCNYYGALTAQSYFTGTVVANTAGNYTGGIAGYNSQQAGHHSRIEDCWSGGEVTGFHNAGGIVGQNQVYASVRNCYSVARVSVTDTCDTNKPFTNPGVGGIAGMNASALPDSIRGCVALNPGISAAAGARIHRVAGWLTPAATLGDNHGYSGMAVVSGGGAYTSDKGPDRVDGADCAEKPPQSFYEGLGWDFTGVWKMGTDGYPVPRWQDP